MGVLTVCARCHRPLKVPTESGYGRVCEKLAPPVPEVVRDLFGYDVQAAALAAQARLAEFIDMRVELAKFQIRRDFAVARRMLGVWS